MVKSRVIAVWKWLLLAPIYTLWVWQSSLQMLLKFSVWHGGSSSTSARNRIHIKKDVLLTDSWSVNWNDQISDSILKQENIAIANSLHFSNISDIGLKNSCKLKHVWFPLLMKSKPCTWVVLNTSYIPDIIPNIKLLDDIRHWQSC